MLLTVEYDENGIVEIHFDEEGADLLVDRVRKLLRHEAPEHDHLATPSWAGWELTEERKNPGAELVNMVNLRFWPDVRRDKIEETR